MWVFKALTVTVTPNKAVMMWLKTTITITIATIYEEAFITWLTFLARKNGHVVQVELLD